jgi:predicted ArsR family transcriptional regulator
MAKRGRKFFFANSKNVVAALTGETKVSRYHTMQLVEMGYLEAEEVTTGVVGRPPHDYVLTGKAKGLLALAQNWK